MKIVSKPSNIPVYRTHEPLTLLYPRAELSQILTTYNKSIGNDQLALEQAAALANQGSVCVFTGQQLGFLGGPIYTILKGISCLIHAHKMGAIPIFWLATEDHDTAEIDHTHLIDSLGNLSKYQLNFPKSGFVEDLVITEKHLHVITDFFSALDMTPPLPFAPGASYSLCMAQLLAYLFRGTGLLFIEPHLLRKLAVPFFARELTKADEAVDAIDSVFNFEKGTNLFYKNEQGKRCKIVKEEDLFHINGDHFSLSQILSLLEQYPERFSTNVAARPVLQSSLFPTAAYIAGPNEIQYYSKLKEYHQFHDVPMPSLIPRLQATFITKQIAEYLEKCDLNPWEPIPSQWENLFPDLTAVEKEERRAFLHEKGLPTDALHRIFNMLTPRNKPQERLLSWWQFSSQARGNLVQTLLKESHREIPEHLYCYL